MNNVLIYQSNSKEFYEMKLRECNLSVDDGYICIINARTSETPIKDGELVISFLSSGSTVSVNQFKVDNNQVLPGRQFNVVGVISLVYGGFAVILQDVNGNCNVYTSQNGQPPFNKEPIQFQKYVNKLIYGLLPEIPENNTLWIVQNETLAEWSIDFFKLKQYEKDGNNNLFIYLFIYLLYCLKFIYVNDNLIYIYIFFSSWIWKSIY